MSETRYKVVAMYKFVSLPNFSEMRQALLHRCRENGVMGTVLLAEEGINGTISATVKGMDTFLRYLTSLPEFADLEYKISYAEFQPFYRLKVKLKKEIVTLGVPEADPTKAVGHYVDPEKWNALISDPEVLVIDTRNEYEVNIGTFERAVDPKTETFREFPKYVDENLNPKKHRKIAMFCTGGIRCEKATSLMLAKGFEEVYHLKGGILNYIEHVAEEESLWRGECFVFDNRVTVDHKLRKGQFELCHACRQPLSDEDKQSEHYRPGVCCPHCHETQSPENRRRAEARQKQIDLAKARNQQHIGVDQKLASQTVERQVEKSMQSK